MDSFVGEIRAFPYPFVPKGWAACNGTLLPISQNNALFALLGTYYGGDGISTFGLPDLQGRTPIHFGTDTSGQTYNLGTKAGVADVTIDLTTMPAHGHDMNAVAGSTGDNTFSASGLPATVGASGSNPTVNIYVAPNQAKLVTLANDTLSVVGGNGSHTNMQPYQAFTFCICLSGYFPTRS